MGCCTSSPTKIEGPEHRYTLGENQLKYHICDLKHVYSVHQQHSASGSVTPDQLLEISKTLNLGYSQKSSSFLPSIQSYYETFKTGDNYNLQQLLTLAILQSNGPTELKSQYLFQTFSSGSSELDKHEVGKIHDLIYKICVKRAQHLLKDDPNHKISESDSEDYLNKMKEGREDFREHFIMSIVGDGESVSLKGFIDWFKDPKKFGILSTSGFRKVLKSYSPSCNPHKSHESLTLTGKL